MEWSAIPWKEKLVFFLFGQGIFLQNGKRIHSIYKGKVPNTEFETHVVEVNGSRDTIGFDEKETA